ncbi:dNTP triphosphohydrolase [Patescibacteria group bacterium]|nr:dNTP triphosphohydrolase [Patescibacteria group bacterium]MBU1682600.1 dNTP triphosphohydrolase [Patescibacteria group bacterium]MBU1935661.1 dNTP triphosphohydrolase [Patescibacteria group bacterium]
MLRTRQTIEEQEKQFLADYAIKSSEEEASKRKYEEKEARDRTCFQRDRDRIIYSKSFIRLKGKTQVVLAGHGDHYRTRLSHTMYVAAIARDIARILCLNEDLTEAIALAHDLGHTCFGHEGESALSEMMEKHEGRFEHNEQSLWIVEKLEKKSNKYDGLNLTHAVRDGLNKHRTIYDKPESRDSLMPSLEAQVVNVADEIAYKYHDLDDGLRAEVFSMDDLGNLNIWKEAVGNFKERESVFITRIFSKLMELMIVDLIESTNASLEENNIHSPLEIYNHPVQLARFSEDFQSMVSELGDFLYDRFYKSEEVRKYNTDGRKIITFLFEKFYNESDLMPEEFKLRIDNEDKHIVVKDYVAGMTDGYAIELYEQFNQ